MAPQTVSVPPLPSARSMVSHEFIYKQLSFDKCEAVGKRIICSNRFGKHGRGLHSSLCIALTAHLICTTHYRCVICFLSALVLDRYHNVCSAYHHATRANDTRHAWRWLNKLGARLSSFRTFLLPLPARPPDTSATCASPQTSTLHDLLGSL